MLTAALIGVTVGAGLTYLLSRRSSGGRRQISPVLARAVKSIPREAIREQVVAYLGKARKSIDDMVDHELRDLRRAIRRQRKRLGV